LRHSTFFTFVTTSNNYYLIAFTNLVEGVNVYKKNVKPNPAAGTTGGVVDKTMPIDVSNVALVDANGKPSRVGIKEADGKKVRYLKTTGAVLAA